MSMYMMAVIGSTTAKIRTRMPTTTRSPLDSSGDGLLPTEAPIYRLRPEGLPRLPPLGRAINTYQTQAKAVGAKDPAPPNARRFIIDFAGGELRYFQTQPDVVDLVASTTSGEITRSFVQVNPQTGGFRAAFDVQLAPGQSSDLRAYLRTGTRALTETWTFPWRAD